MSQAQGAVQAAPVFQIPMATPPIANIVASAAEVAALAAAGNPPPKGTLLVDPTTLLIYGQSDGAGGYGAFGGVGDMLLGSAQTVTGEKTFGEPGNVGKLKVAGTTSGAVTLAAAAVAGTHVLTMPAETDTLATQTHVSDAVAAAVLGLSWKQAVRVATVANGTLATAFENGDTVDGIVLATADRILLKSQSAGAENGIYIVAASGAPTRATDADSEAELIGASVFVSEGTVNGNSQWTCTTDAPITVDATALTFAQLTSGGTTVGADAIWDAAGDLVVGTGANAAARLAIGSAMGGLRVNTAGTGAEWGPPGTITDFTYAQLAAKAIAGTLTPNANYVASNIGEEFAAPDAYTLVPKVARVLCSLPAFGGTWDHTTDATAAIQAAADYAALFEPPRGIELPPEVCIKNSVFIASRVFVYGHNYEVGRVETVIRPHATPSLSTGFMFNFNTLNGTTTVEAVANGARTQCGLFGVMLYGHPGTDPVGMRLALMAGTTAARDLRGSYITQLIKKIDGYYIDNISMEHIHSYDTFDNSEYMIEFGTGGNDGIILRNLNFANLLPVNKAIKIYGANGCVISDCINGGIYIERSNGVTISNFHCEDGSIISESSNVTIESPYFTLDEDSTDYPISATATYLSTTTYSLHVKDAIFIYGDDDQHEADLVEAEINVVSQIVLEVTNCKRHMRMGASYSQQGIRLRKAGVDVDQWNENSFYLSQRGTYDGKFCHGHLDAVLGATMSGITWSAVSSAWGDSTLAATTYYYKTQLLLDVDGLIGVSQSSAERSQAVAGANTYRVGLPFSTGANSTNMGMIRVYRGTATNSYDFYADIPAINISYLIDQGTYINGVAWQAWGPGAMATLSGGVGYYRVTPTGGADVL